MTEDNLTEVELAHAQARAYGRDLARLYAAEKARRKELEITTQKLQAIFDTAPNGLAVVDNELKIIEANPRFEALFQQTSACIGQPLGNLMPVEKLLRVMKDAHGESPELNNVEIEITEPVFRTLLVNLSPLNNRQGWVLIMHDLTERKRLEGLKDEFVNIAAHELRTPLAGVIGFVGVLHEELKAIDNPVIINLGDLILKSTDRLKVIIDELVHFAATQRTANHSLHVAEIDLNRLLQRSVDLLQQQIEAKGLTYQFDLPGEALMVQGDQFILGQAIYQLLKNAIIFNKSGGKIIIRAQRSTYSPDTSGEMEEEVTVVEIEDTGIGIPQIDLERIFDKFYQVEEHLTRGIGGLGLGLTIARRGIKQHGGQLTVTSQLGRGSVFHIQLPSKTQLNDASIDSRLDIAHQQMLVYAKDMAHAVISQRRISQTLGQMNSLSTNLVEQLNQLAAVEPNSDVYADALTQARKLVRQLADLSSQELS